MIRNIIWWFLAAIAFAYGPIDNYCQQLKNNTCTITNETVSFINAFTFMRADYNIVLNNTKIACSDQKRGCTIQLELTNGANLTLLNESEVRARTLIISGASSHIEIKDTSKLSTSAMSDYSQGTSELFEISEGKQGASFISEGGSCYKSTEKRYGFYNMVPNPDTPQINQLQFGSCGRKGNMMSAGGGRLILSIESISLSGVGGAIQANAFIEALDSPLQQVLPGGSGGYIVIKTINAERPNTFNPNVWIEAIGGNGLGGGYGGAGGAVVFNSILPTDQINVRGGLYQWQPDDPSYDGCQNGGSGTIYDVQNKVLYLQDSNVTSSKSVLIQVQRSESLASIVTNGNINIELQTQGYFKFTNITNSFGKASFKFKSTTSSLTLNFMEGIDLGNALFDFSTISQVKLESQYVQTQRYPNITFAQLMEISAQKVYFLGDITSTNQSTHIKIIGEQVILSPKATLKAASIHILGSQFIWASEGALIKSTLNSCFQRKRFECLNPDSFIDQTQQITSQVFLERYQVYNQQSIAETDVQVLDELKSQYNVYLLSYNTILLEGALVQSGSISFCSPNITFKDQTQVDSSAKGCSSGNGLQKGLTQQGCAGAGGANGGYGGKGLSIMTDANFEGTKKVDLGFGVEGSGGASFNQDSDNGGTGGGFIQLVSSNMLKITDSYIKANGGDAKKYQDGQLLGSGGGAAGTIQIIARSVIGNGQLELIGGNGSAGGGGGGSGGLLQISLLDIYSTSIDHNLLWQGSQSLSGGKGGLNLLDQGQDGSSGQITELECPSGHSGPLCAPCPLGFFKYDFGYGHCQPCQNKPENAYFINVGQTSHLCEYLCIGEYGDLETNPQCLDYVEMELIKYKDKKTGVIFGLSFIAFVFVLFLIIQLQTSQISKKQNQQRTSMFKLFIFEQETEVQKTESVDDLILNKKDLRLKPQEIWAHTHRMYLVGNGSQTFPWQIPRDFPINSLDKEAKQLLLDFIRNKQGLLDYSCGDQSSFFFYKFFLPYLTSINQNKIRTNQYNRTAKELFEQFDTKFWTDKYNRTIRFTQSGQVCYIDFLDQRLKKKDYKGPKLPMTILVDGNGTIESPYQVNKEDVLLRSLIHLDPVNMFSVYPAFLFLLNGLLFKLSFYKFNRQTTNDLNQIIDFIEQANTQIFSQLSTSVTLYLFENTYQYTSDNRCIQRRRCFPLQNSLIEEKNILKNIVRFAQTKLLNRKSEVRLGLVVKDHQQLVQMTLLKRLQNAVGLKLNTIDQTETSISKLWAQNQLPDSGETDLEEVLLPESKLNDSEVSIYGQQASLKVKIVDKRVRAFDFSSESEQALIAQLSRDRRKDFCCKDIHIRVFSVFYSLYLLLLKQQSGARTKCSTCSSAFVFSFSLAIDILLTLLFMMHIFQPGKEQYFNFGLPFLFILPAIAVLAPLVGLFSLFMGSSRGLEVQTNMNICLIALNYPLTLAYLIYVQDHWFYLVLICFLIFNKIILASAGSKVRFQLNFPNYAAQLKQYENNLAEVQKERVQQNGKQFIKARIAQKVGQNLVSKINSQIKEVSKNREIQEQVNLEAAQDLLSQDQIFQDIGSPVKDLQPNTFASKFLAQQNLLSQHYESYQSSPIRDFNSQNIQSPISSNYTPQTMRNDVISSEYGQENLDDDSSDEEDTYGIISTSRLRVTKH